MTDNEKGRARAGLRNNGRGGRDVSQTLAY
jgi:hypothetical protein